MSVLLTTIECHVHNIKSIASLLLRKVSPSCLTEILGIKFNLFSRVVSLSIGIVS